MMEARLGRVGFDVLDVWNDFDSVHCFWMIFSSDSETFFRQLSVELYPLLRGERCYTPSSYHSSASADKPVQLHLQH